MLRLRKAELQLLSESRDECSIEPWDSCRNWHPLVVSKEIKRRLESLLVYMKPSMGRYVRSPLAVIDFPSSC